MSILNVNQIQPVGGGNTITVTASDVSASGATITASSFVGNVTGNITSSSTSEFSSGLNVTGGSLGVGTNNPDRALSVSDQTNGNLARFIGPTNNLFIMNDRSGIIDLNSSGTGDHLCLGTQNIERLRISSGGSVGIGTDNPISNLQVFGTNGIRVTNSANQSATTLLNFESNNPAFRMLNTSGDTTVKFKSDGDSFITSGNLGIGTDNPNDHNNFSRLLDINGPSGAAVYMRTAGSSANTFIAGNYGSEAYLNNVANGNLRLYTNSSERLRITNTGALNIGVGTESNNASNLIEMYVGGTDESYGTIRGKYNRTNEFNRSEVRFGVQNNASGRGFLALATGTNTASERMRISYDGSVGFNTSLTGSPLSVHIAGDYKTSTQNVADEGLIFQSFTTASTGDVYPGISWTGNPSSLGRARAAITAVATNNNNGSDLVFLTRNMADGTELDVTDDEKVRITSGGHIGIANTTPSSWGSGVPTVEIKGNSSSQPTRGGFLGFESYSGTDGYGGMWLNNDQLSFWLGESRYVGDSSYVTPQERLRIAYADYPYIGISTNGTFRDQRLPLVIHGRGFGHGWTQQGTTQDAIYLTAGASGNYSTLTLTVDKSSWGSVAYEIHAAAYATKHLHRIGGFYQNGSSISGDSGNTIKTSGTTFAISSPASQKFTMTISGGTWTHPSAWVRLVLSGNGFLRSDLISFAWS